MPSGVIPNNDLKCPNVPGDLTTYVSQVIRDKPYLVELMILGQRRVFICFLLGGVLDQCIFENNDFSGSPANVYTDASRLVKTIPMAIVATSDEISSHFIK